MRIEVKPEEAYHLINHGPCNLITTGDGTRRNVAPINWTMPLNNEPPLMLTAVEEGILTQRLIESSGEFVINVVGEAWAGKILACGGSHGDALDKFAAFHLAAAASREVKPPYLRDSIAHIECRVRDRRGYEGVILYTGDVLRAAVEEEFWDGKALRADKARTLHHLTGGSFAVSERVIHAPKPGPQPA